MARARREPGQVGSVRFVVLATAKMRDKMGELQRLKAFGRAEEEACAEIQKQAELIRFHSVGSILGRDATIEQACAVFIAGKTAEGLVEDITLETYQCCIDHVILP